MSPELTPPSGPMPIPPPTPAPSRTPYQPAAPTQPPVPVAVPAPPPAPVAPPAAERVPLPPPAAVRTLPPVPAETLDFGPVYDDADDFTEPVPVTASPKAAATLIVPLLVGCLVAAVLGVYGRMHEPTGVAVNLAGFSSPQTVKVWLATLVAALALLQLLSALVMYGKLPILRDASWMGGVHRWSGRLAFVASIPVALHCLYALGFADYDTRVLVHSLLGCFFYGAFATKMLLLAKKGVPGWALPVFGGLVFTALSGLFVTSALWFFTTFGFQI